MKDRAIVALEETQIEEASRVLARAFQEDPLQRYTFPDGEERVRISPAHFEALVRYGMLAGEVWTTAGVVDAVGIWWPPEHRELNREALDQSGLTRLPEILGEAAATRFLRSIEYLEEFHKQDVPQPHWYAMVLGVAPVMHGQGLGGRLFEPIFGRADRDGLPCYLETCQPKNVAFYRKHGFEVLREGTEPESGLPYWTFLRRPAV